MADLDPCTLLRQADQAWFDLNMGNAVREVTDANGERIQYTSANRQGLLTMIENLQAQCTTYKSVALGSRHNRPSRFVF